MRFKDLIQIIWNNMWKRRSRTIFTMSGVIIGCIAIFLISSISNGFEKYLTDEMSSFMDTSIITVRPFYGGENLGVENSKNEVSKKKELKDKNVRELSELDFVKWARPKRYSSMEIQYKKVQAYTSLIGIKTEELEDKNKLLKGRFPRENKREIVIGYDLAKEICGYTYEDIDFPEEDLLKLINKKVTASSGAIFTDENGVEVKSKSFKVPIVGIYKKGGDNGYGAKSPIKFANEIMESSYQEVPEEVKKQMENYEEIEVRVVDTDNLEVYENAIKDLGYEASSFRDFEKEIKNTLLGVKLVLGSLAGISLMVAALGITNTMDMAIYERKKEIGIIKVIGGSVKDVKRIFAGEACFISLMGGIISIIIGFIMCFGINSLAKSVISSMMNGKEISAIAIPSVGLVLFIALFSLAIGFLAGIVPASKAAKVEVISAIKE